MFKALRIIERFEGLYLRQVVFTVEVLQEAVRDGLIVQCYFDIDAARYRNREAIGDFITALVEIIVGIR